MCYQPGAALALVEIHVMEHGLLMLQGGGIYRLGNSWYPVQTGDFIWMAPYCPQWFGALGKTSGKISDLQRLESPPARRNGKCLCNCKSIVIGCFLTSRSWPRFLTTPARHLPAGL